MQAISNILKKYDLSYILDDYENNQKLTQYSRKRLAHCLTNYFLCEKIWLERRDFSKINALIEEQFPTEKVNLYYNPVGPNNKVPGGIFFNCYRNRVRTMRKLKLLKYKNIKRNSVESTEKTGE